MAAPRKILPALQQKLARKPWLGVLLVVGIMYACILALPLLTNHDLSRAQAGLADAFLLLLLAGPLLYLLLFRPISRQAMLLGHEQALNRNLAELSGSLLRQDFIDQISATILDRAKQLTGSPHGLIGHVDQNNGDLVITSISREIWPELDIPNKEIVFHEYKGFWGWVAREKRPLFSNNPAADPRSGGLPAGHPPIDRFLAVPALLGDNLVGIIALANASRSYTENDLDEIGQLANYYALALRQKHALHELERSERLYRELFENNPLPMWICDVENNSFQAINDAACQHYGYSAAEFLALPLSAIVLPESANDGAGMLAEKRDLQQHRKKDGTVLHVETASHPINFHGRRCQMVLIYDVTYRIRSDKEIKLLTHLINHSNDAIFVIDTQSGRFIHINRMACQRLGWSREALQRMKVADIAYNIKSEEDWRIHVEQVKAAGSKTFETFQIRKDGSRLPVEVNATFIRLEEQEYLLSVVRDITERKTAEEDLIAERNKLEAVINALGDGLTVQDTDFRILYQNPIHQAKQGSHLGEFCYQAYQNRDQICDGCLLLKCFEDGETHRREASASTADGIMHMEVSASPLRNARGEIVGGIETVRDITDRRNLENQIRHTQKMEALGTLAGGIAHDFNNILTAIIGYSELMQFELPEKDPSSTHLHEVLKAAQRARELVKQILTFSRKTQQQKKPVEIAVLLKEVVKLLAATLPATITTRREVAPGCDGALILADPVQIHQVIMNLCTNAHHAMRETGGELYVGLEKTTIAAGGGAGSEGSGAPSPGNYIKLTIRDSGHGIAEENLGRIFEPYFTTKKTGEGTGLGLSMVLGIVKSTGGHIEVSSQMDQGTTFEIFLPEHLDPLPAEADKAPGFQPGSESILVVDDEQDILLVARKMLEKLGYHVEICADAPQALERFRQIPTRYDLVITDMTMPLMTGEQLCLELLQIRPDLPIVICTGFSETMDEEKAALLGIRKFLFKPYDFQELTMVVREVLAPPA